MFLCFLIPLKGGTSDAGVVSGVIGADVIHEECLKLMQGMDFFKIKPVEESFPHGPEVSFHLGFGSTVPYRCVQEYGADGAADEGELFIDVGRAVVCIKPVRDAVGGDGLFQHFLKCSGAVKYHRKTLSNGQPPRYAELKNMPLESRFLLCYTF